MTICQRAPTFLRHRGHSERRLKAQPRQSEVLFFVFHHCAAIYPVCKCWHVKSVDCKNLWPFLKLNIFGFLGDVRLQSQQRSTRLKECERVFVCGKICWSVSRLKAANLQPQPYRPKASYCFSRAQNNKRSWLAVLFFGFEAAELLVPLDRIWK